MNLVPNNLINQYGNWVINKAPAEGDTNTDGNIDTPPMSFSIPLMGLLGNACVPLNELKGGLQIQIKWTPNIRNVIWTNSVGTKDDPTASPAVTGTATKIISGDLHVSNVSYEASVRTLDDSSYKAVADENNFDSQPIEWSDQHFYLTEKQYLASDLSVAGRVHTIVPSFRFSSLNNIFTAAFSNLASDGYDLNPPNVPHIPWDKLMNYRIGGIQHPTNEIDNLPKMVQHTVACCSNCNPAAAVNMMSSEYTVKNYRDITTIPATDVPTKWDRGVIGVGVKSFPDIDAVGGVDTRFIDTEFEAYKTAVATTAPLTNVWVAQFDCVYVIADGVLSFSDGT